METDFHLICEDSRQFDFLLGWTLFKELSMRNACDTAPLMNNSNILQLLIHYTSDLWKIEFQNVVLSRMAEYTP